MPDFLALLGLARNTAENAVRTIKENIKKYQIIEQDLERDVKVLADKKLESVIVEQLLEKSQYPVLSEESGLLGGDNRNADYRWIMDPLDGSLNFSRGIPINCISIALWEGMEPLLGVVYDFHHDEMFSGLVGYGAWLNNNPIMPSEVVEKKQAVLCTGFPISTDFSEKSLMDFVQKIRNYKKVRLFGSAALSLAYVASGRVDAYMENDIMIWDVAAGIALVKVAGGFIRFRTSGSETILNVYASNKHLFI